MLKDDVASFERTTCGSGVADRISTLRPLLFAQVGSKDTCCPVSSCGAAFPAVLGAAGAREGGESAAALEATVGGHSEGCCAAGWGRTG